MLSVRNVAVGCTISLAIAGLAGCSSSPSPSPSSSPTQSSASPTATEPTHAEIVAFDKTIQEDLNAVGCVAGPVDGVIGPKTDAAIVSFQEAMGLPANGEYTKKTEEELKKAVAAGDQVCKPAPTPTASPTVTPSGDSCTATAILAALPSGVRLIKYACANVSAERWAAGFDSQGGESTFFLKAANGTWTSVPADDVCGAASAGLPESLLQFCVSK